MKKEDLVMDIMFFRTADIDLKNYASTNIQRIFRNNQDRRRAV